MPTKVLVFESDPVFANELVAGLSAYGCIADVVDDASVGLQKASGEPPDLILLAIELPKMNGFSVCNKLKRDARLKGVPLIIMSSDSTEETFEQHRRLRTRAEDYLHKPIGVPDLVQKIRAFVPLEAQGELGGPGDHAFIAEAEPEDAPELEVSELRLDELEETYELEPDEPFENAETSAGLEPRAEPDELNSEMSSQAVDESFIDDAEVEEAEASDLVDAEVEDFADEVFDSIISTEAETFAAHEVVPEAHAGLEQALDQAVAGEHSASDASPADFASMVEVSAEAAQYNHYPQGVASGLELDATAGGGSADARAELDDLEPLEPGPYQAPGELQGEAHAEPEGAIGDEPLAFDEGGLDEDADFVEEEALANEATSAGLSDFGEGSLGEELMEAHASGAPLQISQPPKPERASAAPRPSTFPPRPGSAIPITFDQERSRYETRLTELDAELKAAKGRVQELDDALKRGLARDSEVQKLRRELDDAKAKLATGGGGGSARELLDLREQLNKKDKEILAVRDELSHRERDLLSLRESLLNLEREKTDAVEKSFDLERKTAELERATEAFKNDKEQANKRADDFKRKAEKLKADLESKNAEYAELRGTFDQELQKRDDEHARSLEQIDAQYAMQLAELGELRQKAVSEAQEAAEARFAQALTEAQENASQELQRVRSELTLEGQRRAEELEGELKREHKLELEANAEAHRRELEANAEAHRRELEANAEAHRQELEANAETQRQALEEALRLQKEQSTAELEGERLGWQRASAEQRDTLERALLEQKSGFESAIQEQKRAFEDDTSRLVSEHEKALEALRQAHQEGISSHEERARELLARWEAERAEKAQREAQLVQELEGKEARLVEVTQHLERLQAEYAQEQSKARLLAEELASAQETLNDTTLRLGRELEQQRESHALELSKIKADAEQEQRRLHEELSTKLASTEERARELAQERDALKVELAATRETLGTELGETRAALREEQARNSFAMNKWQQDQASLERAKDALAAALAQIEEAESRRFV